MCVCVAHPADRCRGTARTLLCWGETGALLRWDAAGTLHCTALASPPSLPTDWLTMCHEQLTFSLTVVDCLVLIWQLHAAEVGTAPTA